MTKITYYRPEDYPLIMAIIEGQKMLGLNGPVSKVLQDSMDYTIEIQGANDSDVVHLQIGESIMEDFDGDKLYIKRLFGG